MNNAETKAREIYARNKLKVMAYGGHLSALEHCDIAKQQDRLYGVIHRRQDATIFTNKSNHPHKATGLDEKVK